jgi:Flp pilus assembly protein TadG
MFARPFFCRDERGLALVEFAIALPVMLALYGGGWQLSDGMACKRKVTITTRSLADLTSQNTNVTQSQEASIISAAATVLYPYNVSNATIVVSEVYTNTSGVTNVMWSQADANHPTAAHVKYSDSVPLSVYPLPATMVSNDTYLIVAEVTYNYVPVVLYGLTGPVALSDKIYMSPRLSTNVVWSAT